MRSLSVVLRDLVPDQELHQRVDRALAGWQQALGLTFVDEGRQTDEPERKIDVWTEEEDPFTAIELVLDDEIGRPYVSAVAADPGLRAQLRERLAADLDVLSFDELRDDVRRRGDSDPATYLRLALGAPEGFDGETCELIRSGLRSPSPPVRAQAAMAVGLLLWPQFADDCEAALAVERDEGVARLLAAAAQLAREGEL